MAGLGDLRATRPRILSMEGLGLCREAARTSVWDLAFGVTFRLCSYVLQMSFLRLQRELGQRMLSWASPHGLHILLGVVKGK